MPCWTWGPGTPLSQSSLAPLGEPGGPPAGCPQGLRGLKAEGRKPSINTGWGNEGTNDGSQVLAGPRESLKGKWEAGSVHDLF